MHRNDAIYSLSQAIGKEKLHLPRVLPKQLPAIRFLQEELPTRGLFPTHKN